MKEFSNKKISILGISKSGVWAGLLLKKYKNVIYISDLSKNLDESLVSLLEQNNIDYEIGGHNIEKILKSDCVIVSPGIPLNIELIKKVKKENIPIYGEISLGSKFNNKPIVGITGTNGKTTITTLIGKIFESAGMKPLVGGNIGYPFCRGILENDYDVAVLELSSFQLETINTMQPYISIISNITPDHLDRYSNMEEYILSKKNIFHNQTTSDFTILNFEDENIKKISYDISPEIVWFNKRTGLYFEKNAIWSNIKGEKQKIIEIDELQIFGKHNYENIMCAVGAALLLNIDINIIRNVLKNFSGVEHRIEFVREVKKRFFYNDSKATNVEAVITSLNAFNENIILIMGGRDKNSDYTKLKNLIKKKVKKLILTGEAAEKINKQLAMNEITVMKKEFTAAVRCAYDCSEENDRILFSPACTSYDVFSNYEERGKYFKKIILEKL